MHSVILVELSTKSDLKAIVGAISNVLNVDRRGAVEKAKNLPVTLGEKLSSREARLMADMFSSMGAGISVSPPLDELPATPVEYDEQPKKGINMGCLILIMVALILFAIFSSIKHEWIMAVAVEQFKPNPAGAEKLLQKGNIIKAKRSIQKQLNEKPNDVELLILHGKYYIGAARKRMDSEHWKSYGDMGALPELDSAVVFFRKAESLNPRDGVIAKWISIAEQLKRALPEAEIAARRAVSISPQDVDSWNQLGSVLVDQEQFSQAEQVFFNALKLDKTNAVALKNLAILNLYYSQDAERASKFLFAFLDQEAAATDMDTYQLRTDLTTAMIGDFNPPFEKLSPPPLPFEDYEKRRAQISANPKLKHDPLLQEQLGLLYMSKGDTKNAEIHFIGSIHLNAGFESSRKMLAVIYLKEASYEKALKVMQGATEHGARDPFFWKNIGVLQKYYKVNRAEAFKAFNRYLAIGGDSYKGRIQKEMQ